MRKFLLVARVAACTVEASSQSPLWLLKQTLWQLDARGVQLLPSPGGGRYVRPSCDHVTCEPSHRTFLGGRASAANPRQKAQVLPTCFSSAGPSASKRDRNPRCPRLDDVFAASCGNAKLHARPIVATIPVADLVAPRLGETSSDHVATHGVVETVVA